MTDIFKWDKQITELRNQVKSSDLTPFKFHESYLDEAVQCFHKYLPISCILVSSAIVEAYLCWTQWRKRRKKKIPIETFSGLSLNSLIDDFLDTNIPLESLIDSNEDLEQIRRIPKNTKCNRKKRKK